MAQHRSSQNAKSAFWPFFTYCCVLFVTLVLGVVALKPPQTPEERADIPHRHRVAKNLLIAEKLVAQRLPIPPTHWTDKFRCQEIGNGICYAQGVVDVVTPMGQQVPIGWITIFFPATSQPLYLCVGLSEEGDYDAALAQAGIRTLPPENY